MLLILDFCVRDNMAIDTFLSGMLAHALLRRCICNDLYTAAVCSKLVRNLGVSE